MVLSPDNKIVHGLWVGNRLSNMELLTLKSFAAHGHEFHLWVYEPLQNAVPADVVLRDAAEIIPREQIFRRKYDDPDYHIGKGSIGSPFSDLFRYKLLHEQGGWWVDMDVTCLRPLQVEADYFFRAHPILPLIGNVMKVPAGSELMRLTYEEVNRTCDENTLEWLLPNRILNEHVARLGLTEYIRDGVSARDWWQELEPFIRRSAPIPPSWLFIHWMNEEWRVRKLDKNRVKSRSAWGKLCVEHGIAEPEKSFWEKLKRAWAAS